MEDDTPLFANTSDDGSDQPDDPDDGKNAPADHTHHMQRPGYRGDSPRASDLPPSPAPRQTPYVAPADVHKVNGRQLSPSTRSRDRELLNR